MDRHTLEQVGNQVDELIRHGSPSCIRQAKSIMAENFDAILQFALNLSKPKPSPKPTIADNYPAGGLTAIEPCMFCEDYEQLQAKIQQLEAANKGLEEEVWKLMLEMVKGSKGERQRINAELLEKRREAFGIQKG